MAKIQELYDRTTGEAIYPRTSTQAVYDAEGRDLETRMAGEAAKTDEKLGQYTKTDALNTALAEKQVALTVSDDLKLTPGGALSVEERAKRELFYDMWDSAFRTRSGYNGAIVTYGSADRKSGKLKAYDLELDYEEALEVWKASEGSLHNNQGMAIERFSNLAVRTLLPITCRWEGRLNSAYAMFTECRNLEVVCLPFSLKSAGMELLFCNCHKLRRVIGSLQGQGGLNLRNAFYGCESLEEVEILYITNSFSMADCPKLNVATFRKMVQGRIGDKSSTITITVHADVFAKLTGDTTNEAAAALTQEELAQWAQVLDAALAKNITFATI